MVTHSPTAADVAQRVIHLLDGRIVSPDFAAQLQAGAPTLDAAAAAAEPVHAE